MSPLYAPPERLIVATGDSLQGTSAGILEKLTIGSAGQRKSVISGKEAWVTPASYYGNLANPTGTTNTSGLMMGLGGSATITPTFSGRVLISISGYMVNSNALAGGGVIVYYGTGTAPVNGAALTGTFANNVQRGQSTVAAAQVPFSMTVLVTGLSLATAYWIDVAVNAITAGTASILDVAISAIEI